MFSPFVKPFFVSEERIYKVRGTYSSFSVRIRSQPSVAILTGQTLRSRLPIGGFVLRFSREQQVKTPCYSCHEMFGQLP